MPPVALVQNDDAALAAEVQGLPEPLCQWPLPKAIVMEKGESLEEFSQRSAPDFFTSLQVLQLLAVGKAPNPGKVSFVPMAAPSAFRLQSRGN